MPSNPIKKKTNTAFILGMVIMLVVTLIIGTAIYFLVIKDIIKQREEEEAARGKEIIAYVLNQEVQSGQIITSDLLSPITVYENMIPDNYIDNSSICNFELQDKNGNVLNTDKDGTTYISTGQSKLKIEEDENGYYKTTGGTKEYIEFISVPIVAKINMKANTILTTDAIAKSNEITTDDLRLVEYNMVLLQTTMDIGNFIDIRLLLPNGQDLIVLSKKEIKTMQGNTIGLNVTEAEILMINSAIVEAYTVTGSNLYAVPYVEPGMQTESIATYVPTDAVVTLMQRDSNITTEAKSGLAAKISAAGNIRDWINAEKSNYGDSQLSNIESGIRQQIQNAQTAREEYLSELYGY